MDDTTRAALDQMVALAEKNAIAPAPPPDPLAAARALVQHMFARIEDSKDFTYQVGFGSQTRHLLVQAAVALFPETRSAIGDRLAQADHRHFPPLRANRRRA